MPPSYDLILVGSSFASSFFLLEYLRRARPEARVLVLERGSREAKEKSDPDGRPPFINRNKRKSWVINMQFGGASNCWWACTPRMLEEDFRLHSTFGVGRDWPIGYDDLEKYYCEVEEAMAVSGPADGGPWRRSRPYPQPPHRFTDPDKLLKAAFPDRFFNQPCARPVLDTDNRAACCASGICNACPIDSKFTITNEMGALYEDSRVTLLLDAQVECVVTQGNMATGVIYQHEGREVEARGEFVALGANAIFNPYLLLRSGISHPLLGKRLHEQVAVRVEVDLDGVNNFQGSTSITGQGFMLYKDRDRTRYPAALIETFNVPNLRDERGKWRQRLALKFIFEDLPQERNRVEIDRQTGDPETVYHGHSEYCQRGVDALQRDLRHVLAPLPVEAVRVANHPEPTEAHILGTTVMGNDPQTSVVDRRLVSHAYGNLAVLGSSVFPTGAPANPTLTLSALSIWSARQLFGS